jgi:diguanylate cyclase (GGDEF)-like protein
MKCGGGDAVTRRRPDLRRVGPATEDLAALQESVAAMLASRGEWQRAYEHLKEALDLTRAEVGRRRLIPEQYQQEVARLRREREVALEESLRDGLTASYNRRYLDRRLVDLLAERNAPVAGLAIALVDLDYFKQVNDTFGHHVGDQVLRRVVALLQQGLPPGGFCARYGGEEFVLVLPSVDPGAAVGIAEQARLRVARHPWSQYSPGLSVTISVGLSHERLGAGRCSSGPEEQLVAADGLLYEAKHAGRNRVAYREAGRIRFAEHRQ